jgi:hypothetical protein
MNKKTAMLTTQQELLVDLTFHGFPAELLVEFTQKIVKPYFKANINAAIQDLMRKAIMEEDILHSHVTPYRNSQTNLRK